MKTATLSLPLFAPPFGPDGGPVDAVPTGLPRVEWIERQGKVLQPNPMVDSEDMLSINLTHGCAHRCTFCSVRAAPSYPGDDVVYAYRDTADRLKRELTARQPKPRAVFLCPATDPFPPLAEIQAETARVVEVLARQRVEVRLMTRGQIRPAALAVLAAHRERVKVTVALTTLDRHLQRILEPLTASPRLRLRQLAQLRQLGVPVQAALDPLIPGLTDTRDNLAEVLEALATAGVRQLKASYLFLRAGIADNLIRALADHGWDELVLSAFAGGPVLQTSSLKAARYLPKARRQRGYATLMALAAGLGITVSICGTTNPDFRSPRPVPRLQRLRIG